MDRGKILWVVFVAVLLLGVPRVAGLVASQFEYGSIDPDGAFAWITVHHIVQAIIFVCLMVGIRRVKPIPFGIGWGDREVGVRYLRVFFTYFGLYAVGMFLLITVTSSFRPFQYPLTTTNIVGQLGFQLLLSGPSEELIFRAFAITMLALAVNARIVNGRVSVANVIAAVIFGLAHVSFSFAPIGMEYDAIQVIYATVLGVIYGDCYEKTDSVLYPMIMHSYTNVVMVGLTILLSMVL